MKNIINGFKQNGGFTLIEMLTVVLIIGILTGIMLPQYRRAIQKAQATEAIAMLRVIHDSGERLAAEFGYMDFAHFAAAEPSKATFRRLDMFDETTIACPFSEDGTVMMCESFTYYLRSGYMSNLGSVYIEARKNNSPYAGTQILFHRPSETLACIDQEGGKACDLYNIESDI